MPTDSLLHCHPESSRVRLALHQLYTTPGLPPGFSIIRSPLASGPASRPAICPDLRGQEDFWKKPDPDPEELLDPQGCTPGKLS